LRCGVRSRAAFVHLRGLRIQAECPGGGTGSTRADVKAFTTKQDASVIVVGSSAIPNDADANRDIDGAVLGPGQFDTNVVLEVEDRIPSFDGVASLHYEAPDGSLVMVERHFIAVSALGARAR
jgi:hypothetical protein